MGLKGREIAKIDHKWLIQELRKAYAFEWVVHYYAALASKLVSGINAKAYEGIFEEAAKGEFVHAGRIATRLAELGGEPPKSMEEIEKIAGFGSVTFPKNKSDIRGFIEIFIKMERHAIALYDSLAHNTHGKDLVTHELAEELLAEEVAEEEEYENMLKE